LADRGLAESREKAQAWILAGRIRLNGQKALRADQLVSPDDLLEVTPGRDYVSRGGDKLAPALDNFGIQVEGRVCADIGASTGGFTDVLLQRGAIRVYAIDVGRGLLDWAVRSDPRVVVMERVNARALESLPEVVSLVTIDVSFIGLRKVLPAIAKAIPGAEMVALFKPQFEVGREAVGRGGIVKDQDVVEGALVDFQDWCLGVGHSVKGQIPSAIKGTQGNQEYFFHLKLA
jgi:23S rRNA (cytidine1920-2'-O)/16S rRNA (cytidine1409-2'-O)-methyltransferase